MQGRRSSATRPSGPRHLPARRRWNPGRRPAPQRRIPRCPRALSPSISPGRLHRQHQPSVLADEAGYSIDLPRRGREGEVQDEYRRHHGHEEAGEQHHSASRSGHRAERGELVEDTFDWYAQDSAGNVWYLGEGTAEFENGKIVTRSGSFEAGAGGALPGILLPAEPQVGQKYRQEYLKGEAEDNGEVLGTDQLVEVPTGRYSDALLTRDTTSLEPTVVEYKLYAPGIGPVLALDISGGAPARSW